MRFRGHERQKNSPTNISTLKSVADSAREFAAQKFNDFNCENYFLTRRTLFALMYYVKIFLIYCIYLGLKLCLCWVLTTQWSLNAKSLKISLITQAPIHQVRYCYLEIAFDKTF